MYNNSLLLAFCLLLLSNLIYRSDTKILNNKISSLEQIIYFQNFRLINIDTEEDFLCHNLANKLEIENYNEICNNILK